MNSVRRLCELEWSNSRGSMDLFTKVRSEMDSHMLAGLGIMALRFGAETIGRAFKSGLWYMEELRLGRQ